MEEDYEIGLVNGYIVSGKNHTYQSKVFPTIAEAEAHRKKLKETKEIEKTDVRRYKNKDGK